MPHSPSLHKIKLKPLNGGTSLFSKSFSYSFSMDIGWAMGDALPLWLDRILERFSSLGRLYGHGVMFSPLTSCWDDVQTRWIKAFEREVKKRHYRHITEHFGFMRAGKALDGCPLPVPFTPGSLKAGQNRIQLLASLAGEHCAIGLENLALAMGLQDVYDQPKFLRKLIQPLGLKSGCLLLDVHNLYCQIWNWQLNPEEIMKQYPLEYVRTIHVSGGSFAHTRADPSRPFRRDTHDGSVPDEIIQVLLPMALRLCPNVEIVVFERLGNTIRNDADVQEWREDFKKIRDVVLAFRSEKGRRLKDLEKKDKETKETEEREGKREWSTETFRKEMYNDPELESFQSKFITLLWELDDTDEIIKALKEDPKLKPFEEYINSFEPRCVETAALLVKKWGDFPEEEDDEEV